MIGPIEGIERIQRLEAKWILTPKAQGYTDISFYLLIDLGGSLPAWIVNMAVADGPFETVLNMRSEVQKPKYQNINLSYIEEL